MKSYRNICRTLSMILAYSTLSSIACANPILDGTTPSGITVNQTNPNETLITQSLGTPVSTINWTDFSSDAGHTIRFDQAQNNYLAINRVTGGSFSRLNGNLTANGHIFILNHNGIMFGSGSQVNVGSLLATTSDEFTTTSLPNGGTRYRFTGQDQSAILSDSGNTITTSDGGYAVLSAPSIFLDNTITASHGQVVLGLTTDFTLDVNGNGLITYTIPSVTEGTSSVSDIGLLSTGNVNAKSGRVMVTAPRSASFADSYIALYGVIDVSSFAPGENAGTANVDGKFLFFDHANFFSTDEPAIKANGINADGGTVSINAHAGGSLTLSDTIDASSTGSTSHGGTVTLQLGDSSSTRNGRPIITEENAANLFLLGGSIATYADSAENGGKTQIIAHHLNIRGGTPVFGDVDCSTGSSCNTLSESYLEQPIERMNLEIITTQNLTFLDSTFSDGRLDIAGDLTLESLLGSITGTNTPTIKANTPGKDSTLHITANDDITLSNLYSSGGNVSVTSEQGDITLGNIDYWNGDVTLSAANGTVHTSAIRPAPLSLNDFNTGNISITASGDITTGLLRFLENLTVISTDGGNISLGSLGASLTGNSDVSIIVRNTNGTHHGDISIGGLSKSAVPSSSSLQFLNAYRMDIDSAHNLTFGTSPNIENNSLADISENKSIDITFDAAGDIDTRTISAFLTLGETTTPIEATLHIGFNETNQANSGNIIVTDTSGNFFSNITGNIEMLSSTNPTLSVDASINIFSGGSTFLNNVSLSTLTSNNDPNTQIFERASVVAGLNTQDPAFLALNSISVDIPDSDIDIGFLRTSDIPTFEVRAHLANTNGDILLGDRMYVSANGDQLISTAPITEGSRTLVLPEPPPAPTPSPSPAPAPTPTPSPSPAPNPNNNNNSSGNGANTNVADILNGVTDDLLTSTLGLASLETSSLNLSNLAPAAGGNGVPTDEVCLKMKCPD